MEKIDSFAHVLPPEFYKRMLMLDETLPQKMPFITNPVLTDPQIRRQHLLPDLRQVVSIVNINPEDYLPARPAALLTRKANAELLELLQDNPDLFAGGVAMLALNALDESLAIIEETAKQPEFFGVQLFTRHLGKSVADPDFRPIFETCAALDVPIWLHPVFDSRKPDNNIVFSWEYELSQAMLDIVQAGYFQDYPGLKILIHHAGAMAPYFAGRIARILPESQAEDFRKFYVDTALLGNSKALELALDYFGPDRVLFGTDAPLGIAPAGASGEIIAAIEQLPLSQEAKAQIYAGNFYQHFLGGQND